MRRKRFSVFRKRNPDFLTPINTDQKGKNMNEQEALQEGYRTA